MEPNLHNLNPNDAMHSHLVLKAENFDKTINQERLRDYFKIKKKRSIKSVLPYDVAVKNKLQFMNDNLAF